MRASTVVAEAQASLSQGPRRDNHESSTHTKKVVGIPATKLYGVVPHPLSESDLLISLLIGHLESQMRTLKINRKH